MFIRLLKYALKNIARNKFLSISSILVLTLLMFFINILLILHSVSFKIIDSINSKMTISLYLDDKYDINNWAVIDLINDIKNISEDLDVVYKDKNQVLSDMKKQDENLVRILEKSNPLPNTITIKDIPLSYYENLNYVIKWRLYLFWEDKKSFKNWWDISSYKWQYERIEKVTSILKILWFWLYIIIAIFLLSIAIIIYSIIWNFIYYYKDEIYITRLVWWSRIFIYWPFSTQWIIYSIISFFLSLSIFLIFVKNISLIFGEQYSMSYLLSWSFYIYPLELLLFIIIWWASWYFSSKKYI